MKVYRPSKTAHGIAAARAGESMRPGGERICHDPYAIHFLGPVYRAIRRIGPLHDYFRRRNDRQLPGMVGAIVARTRFIDDHLQAAIANGIRQLVILGAGYDCRAYRFADLAARKIRVFEVDHPATQGFKKRKIAAIFGSLPAHVVYVPIRFHRQRLSDGLLKAGYKEGLRTFFIWEGVSMYLSPEAVDGTLRFMADRSPPGSEMVFDCFPPDVVDGCSPLTEARTLRRYVARAGEPLRFGLAAGAVEAFLQARGFASVRVVNSADCKALYFNGPGAGRKISAILSFVHATVAGGPETG